ncbi:hypothetical protein HDU67_004852 [Dinochytrium kinnereticum]|nr:hypothetical protein HDU67_004852 [Dinochytrium kinnereticum]
MIPLWPTFAFCFGWNAAGFAISATYKTEKFYDMFGTSTFAISAVGLFPKPFQNTKPNNIRPMQFFTLARMLSLSVPKVLHLRQVIVFVNMTTWAARLFAFLAYRVHLLKGDRRFDKIKGSPVRFAFAWTMQAIWAVIVGLPVYSVLSLQSGEQPPLGFTDFIGFSFWTWGFLFETVADLQKLNWQKKEGDARFKKFMNTGLWEYCRYPNYFGEILLWTGNYLLAVSAFPGSTTAMLKMSASPLLTAFLLTGLSGIPLQEKQAKVRFEGNEEYKKYVESTSLIIPWFPAKKADTKEKKN